MRATLVGSVFGDILEGTPGDDVIVAGAGDDLVEGGGGNDLVCGGHGADEILGGPGDDRLYGERDASYGSDRGRGDRVVGGPGDDVLDPGHDARLAVDDDDVGDWVDFSTAARGVEVDLKAGTASGEGADRIVVAGSVNVIGTDFDDRILGTAAGEILEAGLGDDVVHGRAGPDALGGPWPLGLLMEDGDDRYAGGRGSDTIIGLTATDVLLGGPGADQIYAHGFREINGGGGRDDIAALIRVDVDHGRIVGGGDRDSLDLSVSPGKGVPYRDVHTAIDVPRRVISTSSGDHTGRVARDGVERFSLQEGHWSFTGGPGPENVTGETDANDIFSLVARLGAGDDRVRGTLADDDLDGGPGYDVVLWSPGKDRCVSFEVLADSCAVTTRQPEAGDSGGRHTNRAVDTTIRMTSEADTGPG
jgi:Ca2+-binding RTX toxin-like protein